jgi:hypothetical protein
MEAKLSFYPITKNIILLSKQLLQSVMYNTHLYFGDNYIRNGEKEHFAKCGINVYPWLWSKIPNQPEMHQPEMHQPEMHQPEMHQPTRNAPTNQQCTNQNIHTGWELYFDIWDNNHISLTSNSFLNMCLCSNKIFKPNTRIQNIINDEINKIVFKNKKNISIHFRRGDAQIAKQNTNIAYEKIISTEKIIDILRQNNYLEYDIYISSEDKTIIHKLQQELPQYNFINSEYLLYKPVVFSDSKYSDIEQFCYHNPKYIEDIVISAIIDLYFFQRSSIIIGPIFSSAFTYCGYMLSCGYNKEMTKFIDPNTERTDVENISMI